MVNIEVVRKDRTDNYTCGSYKVRDTHYLYLYKDNCTVSPTSLLKIIPLNNENIVEVNFKYD